MVTKIVKWVSIPALLIASLFSFYAASYAALVDSTICVGAVVFVQRAVRLKAYFWAAGLVAIAIVFTPLVLSIGIFLPMLLTCTAACITLIAVFRMQPALAQ